MVLKKSQTLQQQLLLGCLQGSKQQTVLSAEQVSAQWLIIDLLLAG
jgi:hypothetical protein